MVIPSAVVAREQFYNKDSFLYLQICLSESRSKMETSISGHSVDERSISVLGPSKSFHIFVQEHSWVYRKHCISSIISHSSLRTTAAGTSPPPDSP